MTLDPQVQAAIAESAGDGRWPWQMPVDEYREEADRAMVTVAAAAVPMHSVDDIVVPVNGGIPVTLYRPSAGTGQPAIVFFHGGGWVIGSRRGYDAFARLLADRTGATVASVEYRRAPEHPHPAALEDCTAVARWVHQNARPLRVDPERIAFAGDSAGGNLAALVSLAARDEGWTPALQVLLYPVIGESDEFASFGTFAHGPMLTAEEVRWFWRQYTAADSMGGRAGQSPHVGSPLSGLPPTIVVTAELDVLRDEGERFAQLLAAAGVPTVRLRALGMPHAFLNFTGRSWAVRLHCEAIAAMVRDGLATSGETTC